MRLRYFSASSWRVIWKSVWGQWRASVGMRRSPGSQGSLQAGCSPETTAGLGILASKPSQRPCMTAALELPQHPPLGHRKRVSSRGRGSSSRDQGIPAVRGPQECGPWCGHRHPEGVGGSHILLRHLCDFSGALFVPPCSSRVLASPQAPWTASLHILKRLWLLRACSANEGPIFHLLKSYHLSPSVFAVFKLTKSLTSDRKMHSNIYLDPTQLCQTSCNWDFSLAHVFKGDKFKILHDQWKDFVPAWPSLHLSTEDAYMKQMDFPLWRKWSAPGLVFAKLFLGLLHADKREVTGSWMWVNAEHLGKELSEVL